MVTNRAAFISTAVLATTLVCISLSCRKKESASKATTINLSLQRLIASNATASSLRSIENFASPEKFLSSENLSFADTEYVSNDVAISSLKFPIGRISISDGARNSTASGSHTFDAYVCSGSSPDDCMVELTGDALQNLLKTADPLEAKTGTYTEIIISPCTQTGQSPNLKIKATASLKLDGTTATTLYSNATSGLSTTGEAEEVTIPSPLGCGGAVYFLTKDLVIGDGQFETQDPTPATTSTDTTATPTPTPTPVLTSSIPLQLYFDLANVATASGGTSNQGADAPSNGCFGADAQHPYICLNFPDVVATVDTATPTVKRFLIEDTGTQNIFQPMIFGLYFGSDTTIPFGMYSRPFYDGGNRPTTETLIGSMFMPFTKNEDGTLNITTYSNWLTLKNFKLETHTGSMTLDKKDDTSANPSSKLNGTENYSATAL